MQPHAGGVPGATGLADISNPMLQGKQLNKKQGSQHSLETGNDSSSAPGAAGAGAGAGAGMSRSKSGAVLMAQKKVVLVKGILQIDPKLNFMPDWM